MKFLMKLIRKILSESQPAGWLSYYNALSFTFLISDLKYKEYGCGRLP